MFGNDKCIPLLARSCQGTGDKAIGDEGAGIVKRVQGLNHAKRTDGQQRRYHHKDQPCSYRYRSQVILLTHVIRLQLISGLQLSRRQGRQSALPKLCAPAPIGF